MASEKRIDDAVSKLLRRLVVNGPPRTSFFTAARVLERVVPQAVRVGEEGPFARESLGFRHQHSMFSQPNEIAKISRVPKPSGVVHDDDDSWRYEITTCFLGLTGTDSPLPLFLVSELAQDDAAAELQREFLDLFHNRLTALFYRALTKYDFPAEVRSDGSDRLTTRALQLAGFDVTARRPKVFAPIQLLHVAALFASGPPTARSLRNSMRTLLADELGDAELTVAQFTGGWVPLDPDQHNSLGRANNTAALNFVIGSRVRHPANEARIVVKTLAPAAAREFGPGGSAFGRVRSLVATLSPSPATMKLELHVRTSAFPPFVLGKRRIARDACITAKRDRDDAVTVQVFDINGAEH